MPIKKYKIAQKQHRIPYREEKSFRARSESIEWNRLQKYAKAYHAGVYTRTVNTLQPVRSESPDRANAQGIN